MPKIPKKRGGREHGQRIPRIRGRKILAARQLIDSTKLYATSEALDLLQKPEVNFVKFDQTLDVAMQLGVDPRKSEQMVRGAVVLPHGTGKVARVLVFAQGEKLAEAQEAGADFVGGEDLVDKIQKENWLEFDNAIATPDMMRHVGRIGKVLGPRGLMPSPKVGTVTFDVASAVRELKAGRVEFRVDKAGIIHAPIGKISFGTAKLRDNLLALVDLVLRMKPSSSKGVYLQKVSLALTQSPSVRLDIADLQASLKKA